LRHRPRQHHAVELEAEVVMEAGRGVLLDDERQAARALPPDGAARLGRLGKVALRVVLLELLSHRSRWCLTPFLREAARKRGQTPFPETISWGYAVFRFAAVRFLAATADSGGFA